MGTLLGMENTFAVIAQKKGRQTKARPAKRCTGRQIR